MVSPLVTFDTNQFARDMDNIAEYAIGFLEGANRGRQEMMLAVAQSTKEIIEEFIDASARANPELLHHVYEWYQTGSPSARLFDIEYTATVSTLSFDASFTQSRSLKSGATKPFYNKAMVMEKGISVRIVPRNSEVLAFEDDGQQVFTKKPVVVQNPGGPQVEGSFERTLDQFFNSYLSQSFLRISGLQDRLERTKAFVDNIAKGKRMGKSVGRTVGYRWMAGRGSY